MAPTEKSAVGRQALVVPSYVQGSSVSAQTSEASISVTFPSSQTAGNLDVVVVSWNDNSSSVSSITDSNGNAYQAATGAQGSSASGQSSIGIYYAPNIVGGSNVVTVTFDASAAYPEVMIAEYSGIAVSAPFDVGSAASGTSATSDTGLATISAADELIVSANYVETATIAPGPGFAQRFITTPDNDILEDRVAPTAGSFGATAFLKASGTWVAAMAAFRAATPAPVAAPATLGGAHAASPDAGGNIEEADADAGSADATAGTSSDAEAGAVVDPGAAGAVRYVQGNAACPQSPLSAVSVPFLSQQAAGNLNVVIVSWSDATSAVSSVADTIGNVYGAATAVSATTARGPASIGIYYAVNAAAGPNTVTVSFDASVPYPEVMVAEYSGVAATAPFDVGAAASGISAASNSGWLATSGDNELVVAANYVETATVGPGPGFTQRFVTMPNSDILEDRIAPTAGSYTATAPLNRAGMWVSAAAAFRPAGGTGALNPTGPTLLPEAGASDSGSVPDASASVSFPLTPGSGPYLVDARGAPFRIHGEASWDAHINLGESDLQLYLADRQAKGFNALLTYVSNPVAYFVGSSAPWAVQLGGQGAGVSALPFTTNASGGAWDGDPSFTNHDANFASPNDAYHAWVAHFVDEAAAHGMVVMLAPMYLGYALGRSDGWYQTLTNPANTQAVCYGYGQYLANGNGVFSGFKSKPNIIWVNGGDTFPPNGSEGALRALQILQGMQAAGDNHLQISHWQNDYLPNDQTDFAPFLTANAVYTHGPYPAVGPTYPASRALYGASPSRPTWLLETSYWGERGAAAADVRYFEWGGALSTIGGATFGFGPLDVFATSPDGTQANAISDTTAWTPNTSIALDRYVSSAGSWYRAIVGGTTGSTPPTGVESTIPDGTVTWTFVGPSTWKTLLNEAPVLDMQRMGSFLDALPWYNLVPSGLGSAPPLVTAGGGTYATWSDGTNAAGGMDWIVSAITADRTLLVAYVPNAHSGPFSVDMSVMASSGQSRARWYDPTSGQWTADSSGTGYTIPNTGAQSFAIPSANSAGDNDWVLVVDVAAGPGGSPGDASPGSDSASGEAGSPGGGPAVPGVDPPMGWSSWSFVREGPTESVIEAQAQALHDSGLSAHGYTYVNIDDFYYLDPTSVVDPYGRWVVDATKFPNGMGAVASFVHGLGLKFGMYLTPGIPAAAVAQNTPIEGTPYHAADIAIPGQWEKNYNFRNDSMLYIDYSKPGAQEFINSWARLLASYGVDYLKLDGVGSFDLPDVQAWSQALKSSGRTIHFELSNALDIHLASTWSSLSNGWRIDGDIECYCSSGPYPLTSWNNVYGRFADVAPWQPFSGPGARNDLDSIEVGNGDNDGLTFPERQTQLSLWALAASPLLLGVDLTNLDPGDLALLTNDEVIAVNQAGVAARQLVGGYQQVWVANEPDGSLVVGLFNAASAGADITVQWSDLGISGSADVRDLWARTDLGTVSGSFTSTVASHGVTLVRVRP